MKKRAGIWTPRSVRCAECGAPLVRRLYRNKNNDANLPLVRIKQFFCDRRCKGEWQKRVQTTSPGAEWLRARYIDEQLDCVQIGQLVKRDPKTVWHWLRCAGITTRPRGSDERMHFRKGQKGAFTGETPHARSEVENSRRDDCARRRSVPSRRPTLAEDGSERTASNVEGRCHPGAAGVLSVTGMEGRLRRGVAACERLL
jgi:hypothetical protein